MKTVVVYYSMDGNTAMTAEKIGKGLDADLIEVRPVKAFPDKGLKKFLRGGKSAVMAETPALQPYTFQADRYDQVIIGFPVWAGTFAPPIRSFVTENLESLRGKQLAAFACQGGSGADRAFGKLLELLGKDCFRATLVLNDPRTRPNTENDRKIDSFRSQLL